MKPKQWTAWTAMFVACLVCACVIPTRTDIPDESIGPPDTEIFDLDVYRFLANKYNLFFNEHGKIEFIPYDFDISLGTNWRGDLSYDDFRGYDSEKLLYS